MHELSICQSMLRIVDSTMEKHGGAKLRKIFLDIGRGSTIEPILLGEAFAVMTVGRSLRRHGTGRERHPDLGEVPRLRERFHVRRAGGRVSGVRLDEHRDNCGSRAGHQGSGGGRLVLLVLSDMRTRGDRWLVGTSWKVAALALLASVLLVCSAAGGGRIPDDAGLRVRRQNYVDLLRPVSELLRARVEVVAGGRSIEADGALVHAETSLQNLYESRGFAPMWIAGFRTVRSGRLASGVHTRIGREGLRPSDYHLGARSEGSPRRVLAPPPGRRTSLSSWTWNSC